MAERKNFGKLRDVLDIPNLIEIQIKSYADFLKQGAPGDATPPQGLDAIFREIFPIEGFDKQCVLDYVSYQLHKPKKGIVDCLKDGDTYSAPLYVTFRLEFKGQAITEDVYMGDIPAMTPAGTFVVNGAERIIISQLHRSPGICFEKKLHSSGKSLYSYRIIPDRGSWLEVQFNSDDNIYIYLDQRRRHRKFLITTLLRAVGYETDRDMLGSLYNIQSLNVAQLSRIPEQELSKYVVLDEILSPDGETIVEKYANLSASALKEIKDGKISRKIDVIHFPDGGSYLLKCLKQDVNTTYDEAIKDIYRKMRPGDPATNASAKQLLKRHFFDVKRYDLGLVGRFKINQKLRHGVPDDVRVLTKEDLLVATQRLIELRNSGGPVDDIDHLGSRRIRTVGEQLQNQCRTGLLRTERYIREKMNSSQDDNALTPGKLVNPKSFSAVIRDFFTRNQLSQFMDQTNPLSELTNKRRLSALGPGGLNRERAGFEVRDVHQSHYGRVCPIETPEGPNIGLISSMSLYAKINDFGFIETPYRVVRDGRVTDEVRYLTADEEEQYVIAQANAPIGADGAFLNPTVMSRLRGESREHLREEVQLMDVSPKQLVSAAAGLIPFLEHDDANRALMGSNMQRQAVPLLTSEAPVVGTGLEGRIAVDTKAVVVAEADGVVAKVNGHMVVVTPDGRLAPDGSPPPNAQVYELRKYLKSNAGTCVNQKPVVLSGQRVRRGDVLADGAATHMGELALGKNVRVAFMPWCGYNFEDAIVISERVVQEDVYTSIHIADFEIAARETKLGPEEITRDIPNMSEEQLRNLGPDGVIRLGAEVRPGDILVGKITPKSETELPPEERLLRAIFGEKAADVKNSSLTVGSGVQGVVMDVRVERAKEAVRSPMTKSDIRKQAKHIKDSAKAGHAELMEQLVAKLSEFLLNEKLPHAVYDSAPGQPESVILPANRRVTATGIAKLAQRHKHFRMDDCPVKERIAAVIAEFAPRFDSLEQERDVAMRGLEVGGDAVETGPIKKVKVYVATKAKLQVGDKMAGRHGNKGIVAKIVPVEDMPFTADGEPVDIVLNPLGVPSRMNVGQVLETHLGIAAKTLGFNVATPVFDGIDEEQIVDLMAKANAKVEAETGVNPRLGFRDDGDGRWVFDGKTDLFDGRTGERFMQRVTVGCIYMMKLDHLVASKIHARSVGPYSLVTQQPLGGKAQHGGQRFGEMEVWALEAYGAAYTLQEMLTVKSDDVAGRTRIYESVVKGQNVLEAGRPESFNVLLKEMQSLGLDVKVLRRGETA